MTEPIPYQTPLPSGMNLRFTPLPDGIRIARDTVSQSALWREALTPAIVLVIFLGGPIFFAWWLHENWATADMLHRIRGIFIIIAGPIGFVFLIPRMIQNVGIVTEVAITKGSFYWKKQNIWGEKEYVWPLQTIQHAYYKEVGRLLKVERIKGPALDAFSFHKPDELQLAVGHLNHAINWHRNNPS
jgi:hypothetical protein